MSNQLIFLRYYMKILKQFRKSVIKVIYEANCPVPLKMETFRTKTTYLSKEVMRMKARKT